MVGGEQASWRCADAGEQASWRCVQAVVLHLGDPGGLGVRAKREAVPCVHLGWAVPLLAVVARHEYHVTKLSGLVSYGRTRAGNIASDPAYSRVLLRIGQPRGSGGHAVCRIVWDDHDADGESLRSDAAG